MAVQFLSAENSRCRKKKKAVEICGLFHTWREFSFWWGAAAAAADAVLQPWHFRIIWLLSCCMDRLSLKKKKAKNNNNQKSSIYIIIHACFKSQAPVCVEGLEL